MTTTEKLAVEARARIIWGDPPNTIREWLLQEGMNHFEADQIVQQCVQERASSMRKRGLRGTLIGGTLLILSIAIAAGTKFGVDFLLNQGIGVPGKPIAIIWTCCALVGFYGVYRSFQGIERLLLGARAEGADSDLDD